MGTFQKKRIAGPRRKRLPRAPGDGEVRRIIAAVSHPVYRACLSLMYVCGLRIGEALALQPQQIDAAGGVIRVIGKGNKQRIVPLPLLPSHRHRAGRIARSVPQQSEGAV